MKNLYFCLFLVLIISCTKEEMQPTENSDVAFDEELYNSSQLEDIVSINGRLVFKDFEIYQSVIEKISQMSSEERINFSKQYDYEPLVNYLGKNEQKLSQDFLSENNLPMFVDGTLGIILNESSTFQIGKKVIKFGYDEGIETNVKDYDENLFVKNPKTFETKVEFLTLDQNKNLRPSSFIGNWGNSYSTSSLSGQIQINLTAWNQMYGYYIGFGFESNATNNIDFFVQNIAGTYEKKGIFGHGKRNLDIMDRNGSNVMSLSASQGAGTAPQLLQFYDLNGVFYSEATTDLGWTIRGYPF